jgi:eukaryotic-like serine/threonine-protein kinase
MPTQDLQRVREIFEAASEKGADREDFLFRECAGDQEMRSLVERMIAADAEPQPLLDQPLTSRVAAAEETVLQPGYAIGPYRIVRGIASGGMGAVYLAALNGEEGTGFVALKILRGLSSDFSHRFQHERDILTRLQHANIARLLDAGTTPENHPWLAMEYIDGLPLDVFCARKELETKQRVALFRQVCAAVNYLHQNLVVHRDLKPANILVTAEGTVKLLDFGIAKLFSDSPVTDTITGLMTPGYASPEQVRGLPTSTLTDVYGLGILLYELLSGARPFSAGSSELHEILRRICQEDPAAPGIGGELDNIVLKAIRKEPERRYASVEQLDDDLRRYLTGLPVLAQGDSLAYRARKFCVRHKAGIAVAAAMVTVLTGGAVATVYEARIARAERSLADAHAQLAEAARATAEQQRLRADSQAADAEREKAKAERRLAELQKVARAAVGIYDAGDRPPQDSAALIAETARDSLQILQNEGLRDPRMNELADRVAMDARSYALARDPSWHVPKGWDARESVKSQYQVGIDHNFVHQGKSSLFLRSLAAKPAGTVTVSQSFDATSYRGSRVRIAGYFRTSRLNAQAYLYLEATGEYDRQPLEDWPQWKRQQVVIDVPADAETIELGVQLTGPGTVWVDDLLFEKVPVTVPTTQPTQPANLNFTNSH